MLETEEILELERRWRVYDKQRKGAGKGGKDKKYQTYMLVAILAASVTTASLVFFYLDEPNIKVSSSQPKANEIKAPIAVEQTTTKQEVINEITPTVESVPSNQSTESEQPQASSIQEAIDTNQQPAVDNNIIQDQGFASNSQEEQNSVKDVRQQVLFDAPFEEVINLGTEHASIQNSAPSSQSKGFKLDIKSTTGTDISVDELKSKFDKTNSSDLAVLIAKKYYDIEDYKNSEKWALIANELNSENEESWIIFAKSKYNLGQKYDAIKVLRIYNDKSNSKEIENLIKHIENNSI